MFCYTINCGLILVEQYNTGYSAIDQNKDQMSDDVNAKLELLKNCASMLIQIRRIYNRLESKLNNNDSE